MRKLLVLFGLFICFFGNAQNKKFYTISPDSTSFKLTLDGASQLAALPLKCLEKEYPNSTGHTSSSDSDQKLTPEELHPVFYGCFDWHSSVHGHWMLVRLLKLYPDLPEAAQVRAIFNKAITPENVRTEINYFNTPIAKLYERTYGWAWLLKLQQELLTWNDADGMKWRETLQPLTDTIINLWMKFLPKQTYPNRTGVHPNTAFGLVFALDYARASGNKNFENAIIKSSKQLFTNDKNVPATWEPNGTDFLSPSLEESDLMRRVLTKNEFVPWFNKFYTIAGINNIMQLPIVSDRTDYTIVHLDGLSFSRSWCMKGIANELPVTDKRKNEFKNSSIKFLNASLPNIASGNYGGEHWLASFAVYAISN